MPLQPALLAGVLIGVLSALPLISIGNCCCCMWIIGGGMLAAYLDQGPGRGSSLARGVLDGLLAGVVGAVVFLMVSSVVNVAIAPFQQQLIDKMLGGPYDLPPEARDWLEMARDSDDGFMGQIVLFIFHLFAGVIFGALGGLLGALFFWRTDLPPAIGGQQPPPPIPPQL